MNRLNLELYEKLYLIRKSEEEICARYMQDQMKTPMHMSMGGEAISSGICHALTQDDQVLGTYRTHALYLAKTGETDQFFAEMYGKSTGMVQGKGGSMHLVAPDEGLICTSAIVATNIPVGLGAAYANKVQKNGKIVSVFFGDGAIDEGVFWESINSAALMKLPMLFVCEDNGYAVHIPQNERHGYTSIADIISKFDFEVFSEESTDVEVIYKLAQKAINIIKMKQQPVFLHLKYYRYLEHVGVFEDFKANYRSRDEFEEWRKVDPVELQRKKLLNWYKEEEIKTLEKEISDKILKSIERSEAAPFPEPEEAFNGVYS
jgi:acetoin:2,6-dichlorophenolindophenol oxidoreductase subunit alpha